MFAALTGAVPADVKLSKKESLASIGVSWMVPPAWKTDDYTQGMGGPPLQQKASHPLNNAASIDVLEGNAEAQKKMWNGKDWPVSGDQPPPGSNNEAWTPFVAFELGESKLAAVGSHYDGAKETKCWVFLKHPTSGKLIQLILIWKKGDAEMQKMVSAVAKSLVAG